MSPDRPLVSVCMGAYNRERYIREAVDSVLGQTYGPLELIVVDDGSTDRTVPLLKEYAGRIRLIERPTNSGLPGVVRNEAIRAACGSYLAFLDSDDRWMPEKTDVQMDYLAKHPDMLACHAYCHTMDEASRITGIRHEGLWAGQPDLFRLMLRHCYMTTSTVLLRREALAAVGGGFREEPSFKTGEDYEFFLRLARSGRVGLAHERPLAAYRKSKAGMTADDWKCTPEAVPIHEWVWMHKDIWQGAADDNDVRGILLEACWVNGRFWFEHGRPLRAAWFIWKALMHGLLMPTGHLSREIVANIARTS